MASIAIVLGGAVLNATAFIGGNYLARYLSGDDPGKAQAEKERHDRALEKYQADFARYQENRQKLQDFIAENDRLKQTAKDNFTNVDYALKLYNQTHSDKLMLAQREPRLSDYYSPSSQQKTGELVYVGGGALAIGYLASRVL